VEARAGDDWEKNMYVFEVSGSDIINELASGANQAIDLGMNAYF
jgi:hypothetical protein